MKPTLFKMALALGCAVSIAAISSSAQAYRYHGNGYRYGYHHGYVHRDYYRPVYRHYYRQPYYYNNYYNYGGRCKWVNGYWRHGVWHNGYKVCW